MLIFKLKTLHTAYAALNLFGSNIDDHSGTLNWLASWHNNNWQQIAPQEWDEINPEINALLAVPTWNIINKN